MTDRTLLTSADLAASDAVLAACGLRQSAFAADLEPLSDEFFFPGQQYLRAHNLIGQLLWSRAHLAAIMGEPGMGKSLLARRALAQIDERVLCAYVAANSSDGVEEFLQTIAQQFELQFDEVERSNRRWLLQRFLTHQYSSNRLCLLAVDGADELKPAVLEVLREIAMLAVDGRHAVKLLLLGNSSLQHVIDSPRMAALSGTPALRLTLEALSEDQVAAYIVHRLRAAGATEPDALMPSTLMSSVHRCTGGRPGQINALCEEALQGMAVCGETGVTQQTLHAAAERLGLTLDVEDTATPAPANQDAYSTAALTSPEQALLILTLQGKPDSVVALGDNRVLIGRGDNADLRIDSAFVSRYHALIVREWQRAAGGDVLAVKVARDVLLDLGSTNGVLVNGKRMVRGVLKHRDLIQVGPARITYLHPLAAAQGEFDGSDTAKFGQPGSLRAVGADPAVIAFGRVDDAG